LCGAATPDKVEWQEAPRMVIEGEALLTIGGDWMRALREAKDSDGVVTYAFPSEEETFAYTPDSFTVPPQEGSQGSSARRWF
jgi:glucose/mannose transport system substrate-binding protein